MKKIDLIQQKIDGIDFHISHANHVILNPDLYITPDHKTEVNIQQYLLDLLSIKKALEEEKEALTNQDEMI